MRQITRQSYLENPSELTTVIYTGSEREGYIDESRLIFDYWRVTMNSPRSAFDDNRKRLIKKSLKHYSPQELCKAILGCSKSPFHMGQNDRKTKYNGLDLIFRNADKIDKFIELAEGKSVSNNETIDEKNTRITKEVLVESLREVFRGMDDNTFEMKT